MEQHASWLTIFVNHYLGGVALALLQVLHIHPSHPDLPIPEHVVMCVIVFLVGALGSLWLRPRLSVDNPGGPQQIVELLFTNPLGFGIKDLLEENAHDKKGKYVAMVGSVSVFILLANLLSVFPPFSAPTAEKTVPLGCAIVIFLYFNWQGIKHHTVGYYMLTFAGSPKSVGDWLLGILLFPVELISTAARILSLTVRLWANIFASDNCSGAAGGAGYPGLGKVAGAGRGARNFSRIDPDRFYRTAYFCGDYSDVCIYASAFDLHWNCDGG
jgi:F-type H+-transporting ATPase subunit a